MAHFGAALALGVVLLLLGTYLVVGPMTSDQDFNMLPGQASSYALPGWYYFPVGTEVALSWSGMSPTAYVEVETCTSISSGVCANPGPVIENQSGSTGTLSFIAVGGALYGIVASSQGIVTTSTVFSSAYGFIVFLLFTLGIISVAIAFMNYSRRDRYSPI